MIRSDKSILIRAALFIIPAFIVWKLLVGYTVIPVVAQTTDYTIKVLYGELNPKLTYQATAQEWQLETTLFRASRPYTNNTYKSDLKLTGFTVLPIGDLDKFTIGLPLFWLLVLISSSHKTKHIVKGTMILVGVIYSNTILLVVHKILTALQGEELLRVYHEPYIQLPPSPPIWLVDVVKPVLDTVGFMSILIIPVWLAFCYCRRLPEPPDNSEDNPPVTIPE